MSAEENKPVVSEPPFLTNASNAVVISLSSSVFSVIGLPKTSVAKFDLTIKTLIPEELHCVALALNSVLSVLVAHSCARKTSLFLSARSDNNYQERKPEISRPSR